MSPELAALRFDGSQKKAIDRILQTLNSPKAREFSLGGLAGSGKTTILKQAISDVEEMGLNVAVASFTGKAVDVLRKKGVAHAQTLHSLMYDFDPHTRVFHKRHELFVDGVIVDEASMVNKSLYEDLKSFDIPIVWVGDHGQLEPIGDNPNIMAKPDHVLERIYRQAHGSSILDVAHDLRLGKVPDWKAGPEVERLSFDKAMERILDFDIVLCATNITRNNVNRHIRRKKGYVLPVETGETMVCLRNNHDLGVFNGMLLKVAKVHRGIDGDSVLDLEEVGTGRRIPTSRCRMATGDDDLFKMDREIIALDYGTCLTVHKAQGSEFDRVLVIEERGSWDRRRWTYTAATRAAKHLAWTV